MTSIVFWALPAAAGQSERPQQVLEAIGITPKLDAEVPQEATFVDHRGQRVEFGKLLGERPVVLCLVYFRCPMLCSMTADGLVQSVRELSGDVGEEFDVVMVSFDPREGPKQAAAARATALQRYGRSGAGRGWHALTGEQADIEALTDAVGFRYRWDESLQQYAHAAGLVIVTPAGRVSGYLNGVQFPPPELARAIRAADRGDVASTAPQSFLKCYLYDPATGEFGLAVQWTVRGLGLLTVLGLVAAVGRMIYRERHSGESHAVGERT
jgi:protein SCO1/2